MSDHTICVVHSLLLLLPVSSMAASRTLAECRVVKVIDDNVFEEGLSTHEYPDIDVTETSKGYEVSVGVMLDWEQTKGDHISITRNRGTDRYVFRRLRSSQTFIFTVAPLSKGRRQGNLALKAGGEPLRTIAIAYCK